MTFLESARKVLKENNNLPMTSRDISNKIYEKNLMVSSGKTPWASLNTVLLFHSKDEYKNKINYFRISSSRPNRYCLLDHEVEKDSQTPVTHDPIIDDSDIDIVKILLYQITSKELNWKKLSVYSNNNNIEYELSECEEYTYIMEDKAHSNIKIGRTKNDPDHRLNQLKTGNPSISLIHVFPSTQYQESYLHSTFDDSRNNLEWFFYTKGLKSFMKEEMLKYESIINAYNKKNELECFESEMFILL